MAAPRLGTISPALARIFADASFSRQAEAAEVICTIAATETGLLEDDEVRRALEAIGRSDRDAARLGSRLEAMASEFDEEYFRLYAEANETWTPEANVMS